MGYFDVDSRIQSIPVLHMTFVLHRKHDEYGMVSRHKAILVVCGNEEWDYQNDKFSPVVDFTVAKLIICLFLQQDWISKQLDFQNAFSNGHLNRPVYAKLSKHIF